MQQEKTSKDVLLVAIRNISLICLIPLVTAVMIFSDDRSFPGLEVIFNTLWRDLRIGTRFTQMKLFLKICDIRKRNLLYYFAENVRKYPNKVCFIYEDQRWTFKQVDDFSNKIANYFAAHGFQKEDEVALLMENRPEYICMWLGFAKIKVVVALINTNLRESSLAHSLSVINCKAIIFSADMGSVLRDTIPLLDKKDTIQYYVLDDLPPSLDIPAMSLDVILKDVSSILPDQNNREMDLKDKCMYIYTSGTTGLPKAVIIRHTKLAWYGAMFKYVQQLTDSDTVYNTLPLYHAAGGICSVSFVLMFGGSMILRKKFSASNFWNDAIKHKATVAQYIGEMCRYLLAQPMKPEETMHSIRIMTGNGMRKEIWTEFVERFKIGRIAEYYGSTEGTANMLNLFGKTGAVGFTSRIAPWFYPIDIIRVDQQTGEPLRGGNGLLIRCKPGEPGELLGTVRLNHNTYHFDGYTNTEATKKKLVRDCFRRGDVGFLSGDIMVMDEEGYFYFVDRTGDTFRWKGENVSTNEVESVISKVMGLATCIVYGVKIPGCEGRAGMAAIQQEDKDINLTSHYEDFFRVLPSYAIPVFIRICKSIEATGTYKLSKVKMQEEEFDLKKCEDPLYFLNPKTRSYVPLDQEMYQKIMEGKMRI